MLAYIDRLEEEDDPFNDPENWGDIDDGISEHE